MLCPPGCFVLHRHAGQKNPGLCPTRVLDEEQGGGIGRALLLRSLAAMRAEGYAYAVIGGVGPQEFYKKCVGAMLIPDSVPGIYRDFLGGMKE